MKLVKIKDSAPMPMGEYKPTIIDERKKNADFLVKYYNGGSYTIDPRNIEIKKGRGVKTFYENGCVEVTENKLKKLQEMYPNWEMDY